MLVGFVICLSLLYPAAGDNPTCLSTPRGENYNGIRHVTAGGLFCQRWDSLSPHRHNYEYMFRHRDYCRNSGNDAFPWCYTTSSEQRWQYCDIPSCSGEVCLPDSDKNGRHYYGTKNLTVYGHVCQHWSATSPHQPTQKYIGLPHNYCRNPDNDPQPWCYTTHAHRRWEYCYIPSCRAPPGPCLTEADPKGYNYRGTVSTTVDGTTCQMWSSQYPHEHEVTNQGNHNYCRHPAQNAAAPWCYTTNPRRRWAFCNIRRCY